MWQNFVAKWRDLFMYFWSAIADYILIYKCGNSAVSVAARDARRYHSAGKRDRRFYRTRLVIASGQ